VRAGKFYLLMLRMIAIATIKAAAWVEGAIAVVAFIAGLVAQSAAVFIAAFQAGHTYISWCAIAVVALGMFLKALFRREEELEVIRNTEIQSAVSQSLTVEEFKSLNQSLVDTKARVHAYADSAPTKEPFHYEKANGWLYGAKTIVYQLEGDYIFNGALHERADTPEDLMHAVGSLHSIALNLKSREGYGRSRN